MVEKSIEFYRISYKLRAEVLSKAPPNESTQNDTNLVVTLRSRTSKRTRETNSVYVEPKKATVLTQLNTDCAPISSTVSATRHIFISKYYFINHKIIYDLFKFSNS
jgi:hypothetical protein